MVHELSIVLGETCRSEEGNDLILGLLAIPSEHLVNKGELVL